jgi:hypothetical protein
MRRNAGIVLLALGCGLSTLAAQTTVERGPDGGPSTKVPGIDVPNYPDLPFSGVDNIVWTRTSSDGGTTTLYTSAKVVRDSQGRLYREHHHFAPADVDQARTLYIFYILDPVTRSRTDCEVATHVCTISNYRPLYTSPLRPVGPFDNNRRYLARESLGTQTMDGLPVTGARETITIAPGTVGNDREMVSAREFWYSADLKTNLTVTRQDPHDGTQAIHLVVDSRSEPEPAVFAIPSGYSIRDIRTPVVTAKPVAVAK